MIEDELVKIWQSSPNTEVIKFEKSRLMIDVQSDIDRLNRTIKFRDMREVIAAAIVAPAFLFAAYKFPFVLTKIASIFFVFYAAYIVFRLKQAKKHKPGSLTESYLKYLYQNRDYFEIQKHLLDTVLYWYILPGYAGLTLFTLGFEDWPYFIRMQIIGIAFMVATYFMNKIGVKKTIVPQLKKINELIQVMETNTTNN